VQTEMIQWAMDSNVSLYDMGGIGEASPEDGLFVFKRTFVKDDPREYIGEIDVVLDDATYDELVRK
ncbi:MAG: UDP-N-acetylmuramoylpentapeptide-lysine N(6)-alanyltransferase, partial [Weissella cibaria]